MSRLASSTHGRRIAGIIAISVVSVVSVGCGGRGSPEAGPVVSGSSQVASGSATEPASKPTGAKITCDVLPFAPSTPVPEASGAAWMTIDGKLGLVVISDSGNDGAFAIIDPDTGDTRAQGTLPLGDRTGRGGGDDLEGVAIRDGKLVAVTSSGWIRVWERGASGFTLVDGPYALGPVDLPDKGPADRDAPGMVCSERKSNCGRDYEGLCLAPAPSGRCLGFVASKTDGTLYCVIDKGGKLAVDRSAAIPITAESGRIADCAFSETGTLVVGSNLFERGRVYRVTGWSDPAQARVEHIGELGIGFPETIAARGDVIYRMSDTGGAPSLMAKYQCR